jgi:hypothetical protein
MDCLFCSVFLLWPLAVLCMHGVRDPHSRTDTATLVLTTICFLPNAFGSMALVAAYGFRAFGLWWFWPLLVAALATGYGVFLCVKARWT